MEPDEVTWITDKVAITNFFSAHCAESISQNGVRTILCLDRDLQGTPAQERGLECVQVVHLIDGDNEMRAFREAVDTLKALVGKYGRVLVHCRAGRSRSVAVVAGYLVRTKNLGAHQALDMVKTRRETAVAPELVTLVERLEP